MFQKITEKTLIVFCLVYLIIISVWNFVYLIQNKAAVYIFPLELFCIVVFLVIYRLKAGKRIFAILLFVMAFCLKSYVAVRYNAAPQSDFKLIYNAAIKLAQGDFSFSNTKYFSLWSYQTGIVLYYGLLLKLGLNVIGLKICNCFFIAGVNVLVYKISERLVGDRCARFISVMYLFYPATFFLCSVLTNQHVSNFLILLGVYLYIFRKTNTVANTVLAAVMIAIGNALRPQGILVVAAFIIWAVIELLHKNTDKKIKVETAVKILGFVTVYVLLGKGMSMATQISGLNQNGLSNNFPLYKIVVGLNSETAGCYSYEDASKLITIKDSKLRNQRALGLIKERLTYSDKMKKLMHGKHEKMWVKMDTTIDWGFKYLNQIGITFFRKNIVYENFKIRILKLEKVFYCFIFVLATVGVFAEIRKHKYKKGFVPISLIIAVNFAVYCMIEIQSRYRDFQMIFIFILAAVGIKYLAMLVKNNLILWHNRIYLTSVDKTIK
ncbi:integral membrane protein [Ruminiclostridium cellulolyticum H10]|uniref:Integral membrane protein n=1 Tax=Ruminiclostridium cellulolyticum (strain ATCC 35319 / DSM 5812 / JCM 6584 / H10) TaxID=394503 RepID=B8I1F7_RUMCH|nr:integral membrane protein [Ruminiclostridium cellulolyticum H10]